MEIAVIDVGGTFIKYACMNEKSEIISRGKVPTPMSGREEFIDTIVKIYESMPETEGIAISLPGIIDAERGYCVTSGALNYNDDFAVVETLQKKCKVNVTIENDAKCAAIAEMTLGALKDVNDGFVVVFGTGIGSAFIKDRKLHRGHHFSAGEISFILMSPEDNIVEGEIFGSRCGTKGLCELYAEAKSLPVEEVDGVKFFDAIKNGDETAINCLNEITHKVAVQISNIQNLLDPERFAIGGGISAQPIFIEYIRRNLDKLYEKSTFNLPHAEVVACKFLNDANLIGALQIYLEKFN